jgi:hypothetical protein
MKVSELIRRLEAYKAIMGDITLYSEKEDGRSTWASPMTLDITCKQLTKKTPKQHYITVNGGY